MALSGLPRGWTFLPATSELSLATPCLLLDDPDPEVDERGIPIEAMERGFPREGLDCATLEDTAGWARQFENPPSDTLLLESFLYYLHNDAFLPAPNSPPPPPWEETEGKLDREFYDSLGPERSGTKCRRENCIRGAVSLSVLCRPHHFESIKGRPSPFSD
jgi:hypothetical protein